MLRIVPLDLDEANAVIEQWHRHHKPVPGQKFAVGVMDGDRICGAAIVSRPVARKIDRQRILEITRVCTDGTRNACSMLYGACRKAALAMGYQHVITYTLPEEGGASLRAAGFRFDGEAGGSGRMWGTRKGREQLAIGNDMIGGKWRWVSP
jgi:hypothetical protein